MSGARSITGSHPHPLRSNPVLPEDISEETIQSDASILVLEKVGPSSNVEFSVMKSKDEGQIAGIRSREIFPENPYCSDQFTTLEQVQDSNGMTNLSVETAQQSIVPNNKVAKASNSHKRKTFPSLRCSMWMSFGSSSLELQSPCICWPGSWNRAYRRPPPNLTSEIDTNVAIEQQPAAYTDPTPHFANIKRLLDVRVNLDDLSRFHTRLLQTYLGGDDRDRKRSVMSKFRKLLAKKTHKPTRQEIEDLEMKIKQIKRYQHKIQRVIEMVRDKIAQSDIAVLDVELKSIADEEFVGEAEVFLDDMGNSIHANVRE